MRKLTVLALFSTALSVSCGSDQAKPPQAPTAIATTPPPAATNAPNTTSQKPGDNPSQSNINISDEIRKACGITDAEAFFAFDSANVRPQDQAVLKKLADCFMTGPLKGRQLRLVGHADPRGDDEYNMVLGGRRADNVKGAIVSAGMTDSKIATTSRGELDATGTDEEGWSKDRRVDVVLGS